MTPLNPLPSVRDALVPESLTQVKLFADVCPASLERSLNEWILATGNLVVSVSAPAPGFAGVSLAVLYVPACEPVGPAASDSAPASALPALAGAAS